MAGIQELFTRFFMAVTATRPGQWLFARLAHRFDGVAVRSSGGRRTLAGSLTGLPVAMLTTIGARSGLPRRVPVVVVFDGELPVLIASNWGQSRHPGWYYNLRANPHAELELDGWKRSYMARETKGEEREKFWALAVSRYPGYETYRQRAGVRQIAVWLLEPNMGTEIKSKRLQRTQRE